jgi:hypothetical protein
MPLAVRRFLTLPALALAALASAGGAGAQNPPEAVIPEDLLAPQWNEQGARVAVCPAFAHAPHVEHFVSWGWYVVELDVLSDPQTEVRDFDNPASPTGATRLVASRVSAAVRRASSKLPSTVTMRFVEERAALENGQPTVQSSDKLDGRLGRAALQKGRRVFAIAFPDPYAQGDLALAAVFEQEDQLVGVVDGGDSPSATFDELAARIREQRERAEAQIPVDPRQQ